MKTYYNSFLSALLILALLLTGSTAVAQTKAVAGKINGNVIDGQKKPLEYVTIILLKAQDSSLVKSAFTDLDGKFVYENIVDGEYLVSAMMMGYKKTFSKAFTVNETNRQIIIDPIKLIAESKLINEVSVVAQKPFIERKMDKLVLNVASSSASAGNTALEVLEKAPGVTIDKDDNISMKGKQGVLIMLDGKPTYMSSADVANMLRNMQSDQIETIELITSPSARYDAAGTSGIINIKTKKNKNMGLNGTLTAGSGYGRSSKYNGGTNLNFRKGKFNAFGNYNYGNNGRLNNLNLNREVDFQDTLTSFRQLNNWDNRRFSNSYKAGIDFFINSNHTIGVLVNGYANKNDESSSNSTLRNNNFNQSESIDIIASNKETYSNIAYNMNYKGTLDTLGKELTIDLDYSNYSGMQDELRNNFYTLSDGSAKNPLYIKNYAPSTIKVRSLKADYTHPLSKSTKVEAGVKSSRVRTDNDLLLARLAGTNWVADQDYTNRFIYEEDIYAGYLNFATEIKNTGIQLGLRAEQTQSTGNSVTKNELTERNYLEFFPSVSLSQKISKDHQLGLSYSRRIDRPSYDNLNPFLNFLDEYTFQKGNPLLRPQFTSSFDLSHTYKGGITTSLNYSRTKDAMIPVTEQEDETKKTYAIRRNIDQQEVLGLNIYAPIPVAKWWNINNNVQLFYMGFKTKSDGGDLNSGQTAVTYNMDHSFTINKTFTAETSVQYQSPLQYGIFKIQSQTVLNAGLRKSFMDKKASIRLSVNDIFNTRRERISTTYQNMNLNFTEKGETQVANLTLSYNFGKKEVKDARRRNTGLEDEAGRMKN